MFARSHAARAKKASKDTKNFRIMQILLFFLCTYARTNLFLPTHPCKRTDLYTIYNFSTIRQPTYKTEIFRTFQHNYLQISFLFRNFAAILISSNMKRPVFREYKSTEECIEAFERMLHLREEWEEKVRQREIELGIYNEAVC